MNATAQPVPKPPKVSQNWKLTLSYDGTDFSGWQVQPGEFTVQGELQAALRRVTGESPLPQGSGRTDAGVHALAQVASFALFASIPAENLQRALNRTLPASIRVIAALPAAEDFHARHSTVAKTYEYRVFLEKPQRDADEPTHRRAPGMLCPPFLARYVYSYPWPVRFAVLQEAAGAFVGTHNFMSFAATDPDATTRARQRDLESKGTAEGTAANAIRTVYSSSWHQQPIEDGLMLVYRVRGSGFLHHMVRNLVGTMLDVGRGHRSASAIAAMMAARSRDVAGPMAPARGLFLHSVEYGTEAKADANIRL